MGLLDGMPDQGLLNGLPASWQYPTAAPPPQATAPTTAPATAPATAPSVFDTGTTPVSFQNAPFNLAPPPAAAPQSPGLFQQLQSAYSHGTAGGGAPAPAAPAAAPMASLLPQRPQIDLRQAYANIQKG